MTENVGGLIYLNCLTRSLFSSDTKPQITKDWKSGLCKHNNNDDHPTSHKTQKNLILLQLQKKKKKTKISKKQW